MEQPETIVRVHAREVLDSRGDPTVEVEVTCAGGARGRAIVPSGASTGRHEALELRDGEPKRYRGKGVRRAVANVLREIGPRIVGSAATDQRRVDRTICLLDGTPDKSRLGANAVLGVSLACAHAGALARGVPLWRHLTCVRGPRLPMPMVNMISGGRHAGGNLDFQDFLLLPVGARSYAEALEMAVAVYRTLGEVLTGQGFDGVRVGDEGGYGPRLKANEQAVEFLLLAVERAGCTPGKHAAVAVDVAGTQFFRDGRYYLRDGDPGGLTAEAMVGLLRRWVDTYPIWSIEDGLAEDDWDGWRHLTEALGGRVQLVGDDLFVTNPDRLRRGIAGGVGNSVLVKLNQIGTLSETLDVVAQARAAGYGTIVSARSGETEDATIADLAVGTGAGQIKIGSVARGERLAKYNQLCRIAEELGDGAGFYLGWEGVRPRTPPA